MEKFKAFLKRKNIEISARRYGIDALGAMAQGLFASLLVGTILSTLGTQLGIEALVTCGGYASAMSGAAMAVAIGYSLQAPPLVLFSLATVGHAANALGSTTLAGGAGAGGPLAVLFIAIIAAEFGKAVSKETKVDILVTPVVTILVGVGLSALIAPAIGTAASSVGADRSGRRRGPCRLLRPDDRLCGLFLPGKRLGRPGLPGHRHLHAADGQYCQKPQDLAAPDPGVCHYRSHSHLRLPSADEQPCQRCRVRYGHLRTGRTDRCLRGLGRGCSGRNQSFNYRI